jgi:hypothetical protein
VQRIEQQGSVQLDRLAAAAAQHLRHIDFVEHVFLIAELAGHGNLALFQQQCLQLFMAQ